MKKIIILFSILLIKVSSYAITCPTSFTIGGGACGSSSNGMNFTFGSSNNKIRVLLKNPRTGNCDQVIWQSTPFFMSGDQMNLLYPS